MTLCFLIKSANKYSRFRVTELKEPSSIHQIMYVAHLESKERLRIQPAQLFNFS